MGFLVELQCLLPSIGVRQKKQGCLAAWHCNGSFVSSLGVHLLPSALREGGRRVLVVE